VDYSPLGFSPNIIGSVILWWVNLEELGYYYWRNIKEGIKEGLCTKPLNPGKEGNFL